MRFIGSIFFAMMLPSLAFSTNYSGQGTWRSTGGDRGEYTVDATIEEQNDFVAISQTLYLDDQVLTLQRIPTC